MRTNIIKHSAIVFIALFFSCSKDDTPETYPKDIAFTEYSLEGTDAEWVIKRQFDGFSYNLYHGDSLIVVNSDMEMLSNVSGEYSKVDFDTKTLLLAYGQYNCETPHDIEFWQVSESDFKIIVNFEPSLATAVYNWETAMIVDKLPANSKVEMTKKRLPPTNRTRASVSDQPYYWYNGKKTPMTLDAKFANVIVDDIAGARIQKRPISELSMFDRNKKVRRVMPFYSRGTNNTPIGTSDIFYLKLKSAGDFSVLNDLATEHNVRIIKEIPYTPNWYILSILESDFESSVAASNFFYETGLFADVDPAFMFEFAPNATYDSNFSSQWGLYNMSFPDIDINVIPAWEISTGSGVNVAVIDTPIDNIHTDLNDNIHPSLSYNAKLMRSPSAPYVNGALILGAHGTQSAGVIATEKNGDQTMGVSYDSKVIRISHPLEGTSTTASELASGINWAWQNEADIINNSWGDHGGDSYGILHSAVLESAIDDALTLGRGGRGCVVVFAAGNYGIAPDYPGDLDPRILRVGAVDPRGQRAVFNIIESSGYGQSLDVVAPGYAILTAYPENTILYFNGTSAAAPHVSGIAALMLSVNPNLTAKEVSDIIERTSRKVGGYSYASTSGRTNGLWNNEMGYGLVNAYAAVATARNEFFISGPSEHRFNEQATYRVSPSAAPSGATFAGWTVSPDFGWSATGLNSTSLGISFYTYNSSYTITANFNLPGGKAYSVSRDVNLSRPNFTLPTPVLKVTKHNPSAITGWATMSIVDPVVDTIYEWQQKSGNIESIIQRGYSTEYEFEYDDRKRPVFVRARALRATAYSDWSNFKNGPVYEPDSYMNPLRKKEEEI